MKKDMRDLVAWSIKTAKSAGADECRVGISTRRFVEISYRKRKPENIKEATTKNLGVEIYVNGRYSAQNTSDLRKDALKDFISNAVSTTKLLAEDPFRTLPDPKYYKGRAEKNLGIFDSTYEKFSSAERHNMVKAIEDACLSNGGDKVISVIATEHDSHSESFLMSSNGFEGSREGSVFYGGASMTAQGRGNRRPAGYSSAVVVKRNKLPDPEKIGEDAAKRTLDLLGAKKIKTETLPIIIENRVVGRIFGGLLTAMYGSNIQQKRSFLADKKGQKIGSEHLTLIDDPFIPEGLGSQLFDGDGFASKKRIMFDSGVLKEFYIDWYYSKKLKCKPTTGRPSNLVIPPGKRGVKEIMKDLGRGILITGFIGGNSNPTTGDASIGIVGNLFDSGKPMHAVSEMNIADNHLKIWKRLAEVANDPWTYSSYQFPSLVFTDVVVSGI